MESLLVAAGLASLALGSVMTFIAWRIVRVNRHRESARVQLLSQLAFPGGLPSGPPVAALRDFGPDEFDAVVDMIAFNDNEEVFSAQHVFRCWTRMPLATFSAVLRHDFLVTTGHNPNEVLGAPGLEAGWLWIDGHSAASPLQSVPDPAILALLVERTPGANAVLPFSQGVQANGALRYGKPQS